jgi:hypothetical protein
MSHFVMGVIVPKKVFEDGEIETYIQDVMAKYDESLETAPHVDITKEEVFKDFFETQEMAKAKNGNTAELFKKYIDWTKEDLEKHYYEFVKDWYEQDIDVDGNIMVTYNPNSKWDWWVVGGRWDCYLQKKPDNSDDGGFNFGEQHHDIKNNFVTVKQHLIDAQEDVSDEDKPTCYGLVYNGIWFSRGDMGWFGCSSNDKEEDEFMRQYLTILKRHQDDYVVALDCHI